MMLFLLAVQVLQLVSGTSHGGPEVGLRYDCPGVRKFSVRFQGLWSRSTLPLDYPDGAHFSPLVVVGHSGGRDFPERILPFSLFEEGGTASPGLEELAEKGVPDELLHELEERMEETKMETGFFSIANMAVTDPPTGTTSGTATLETEIVIDGARTMISAVSMAAPSSDFFTGFVADMCNTGTGQWRGAVIRTAYVYDAGTDSGNCLNCDEEDKNMDPKDPISMLQCDGINFCDGSGPVRIGKFFIEDLGPACEGERIYTVKFHGSWTSANHPVRYPPDAHFSPLVAAAHNQHYSLFPDGPDLPCCPGFAVCSERNPCFCSGDLNPETCPTNTCNKFEGGCCDPSRRCRDNLASAGLERLAETGMGDLLLEEMKSRSIPGCCQGREIPDIATFGQTPAMNLTDGMLITNTGTGKVVVMVDETRSSISVAAMAAPSSDFFIGLDSLEMCNFRTGAWKEQVTLPTVHVYDAGTDAGDCTTCDVDIDQEPQIPITEIMCTGGVFCEVGGGNDRGELSVGMWEIEDSGVMCKGKREYKFTFEGVWSGANFPLNYPSDGHFSLITIASHNKNFALFVEGTPVTPGLEMLAEKGEGLMLQKELRANPDVLNVGESSELPTRGVGTWVVTIVVDPNHPFISAAAMVAPSSDWFVSANGVNMCDVKTGQWKEIVTIDDVEVCDAGTDDGDCLICEVENLDTQPQGTVSIVGPGENFCADCDVDLGTFTIEDMGMACDGDAKYMMTFNGVWNSAKFPLQYPPDAHFSQITVASHTSNFYIYREGKMATHGLEVLAELGMGNVLQEELGDMQYNVKMYSETENELEFGAESQTRTTVISVDTLRPLLSGAAMAAPSSDWFIGFDSANMCNRDTGEWKRSLTIDEIYVYSAGTDNGQCFTCADDDAEPQNPIKQLVPPIGEGEGFFCNDCTLDLGEVELTKIGTPCTGERTYKIDFSGNWNSELFPLNYPSDAHFSQLSVASHNMDFELFKIGGTATDGLETLAELGMGFDLQDELKMNENVYDVTESINRLEFGETTQTRTVTINLDPKHSKLSGAAMVAPSSSWFIGFSGIEMCNMFTGEWKEKVTLENVNVYDAGTDNGNCFTCPDDDADPSNPISMVTCGENFCSEGNLDLGTIEFMDQGIPCKGEMKYEFMFTGEWSRVNHPLNYPDDAHFGGFTIAAHSSKYEMWSIGGIATEGMEVLAEFGAGLVLQEELRDAKEAVKEFTESPGSTPGDGTPILKAKITVDAEHPLISAAAMAAPSSDWFAGLSAVNMCDKTTGQWKTTYTREVANAYDAGTDSGDCFVCSNEETSPNDKISMVQPGENFVAPPQTIDIGTFVLRQYSCSLHSCETCLGTDAMREGCVFTEEGCMHENESAGIEVLNYCPAERCPMLTCAQCAETQQCVFSIQSGCVDMLPVGETATEECPMEGCGNFCCQAFRTLQGRLVRLRDPEARLSLANCARACAESRACRMWTFNATQPPFCTHRGATKSSDPIFDRSKIPGIISGVRGCDPLERLGALQLKTPDCDCSKCPSR